LVSLLKITKVADKSDTAKVDKLIMIKWLILLVKSFLQNYNY
jgi:hypothetical protein